MIISHFQHLEGKLNGKQSFHDHQYVFELFVLQLPLYPTVGLQTPGEVVEANFGQLPYVFDIEDYMKVCSHSPVLVNHPCNKVVRG
jgi:hypothetical protein